MKEKEYKRSKVIKYAEKWAYKRNPQYYNYDNVGGDCTNFASQCIFAGCKVMNYSKKAGWYYKNAKDKTPSWTGVEFLYKFLIKNKDVGPQGVDTDIKNIEIGDLIQLSFENNIFTHSLIVTKKDSNNLDGIYIASHTFNSYNRKVSTYQFEKIRFIHINKIMEY